jgi:glutaredoxin
LLESWPVVEEPAKLSEMEAIVYGSPSCIFCKKALDVLEQAQVPVTYRDIAENEEWKNHLVNQGLRTVPQIYLVDDIGEGLERVVHIGGYEDLLSHI